MGSEKVRSRFVVDYVGEEVGEFGVFRAAF